MQPVVKGVFIAFGIMVVCFLIPLVHFVAAPASPFIGGYIGISSAKSNQLPAMAKAVVFGCLLGGLFFMIAAAASAVITTVADVGRFFWILWIGVAIGSIYTASMGALGAMFSLLSADSKTKEPGPETPEPTPGPV